MASAHIASRSGFTLVELIVAIFLLTCGLLALEAGLAVTLRSMAEAKRESSAGLLIERQRDRAVAACTSSTGVDSLDGVTSAWTASASAGLVHTSAIAQYNTGRRVTSFTRDALAGCP